MGSDNESDNFSWTSDDELEILKESFDTHSTLTTAVGGAFAGYAEVYCCKVDGNENVPLFTWVSCLFFQIFHASSSSGPSSTLFRYFKGMGYSDELVQKAIEENEDGDPEAILNSLLTYAALQNSPESGEYAEIPPQIERDTDFHPKIDADSSDKVDGDSDEKVDPAYDSWSSDYEENLPDDLSDSDGCLGFEEGSEPLSELEQKIRFLADMGYSEEEAAIAIERCGPDSSIEELADFICAAQMARAADASYVDPPMKLFSKHKRRKLEYRKKKRQADLFDGEEPIRLPKPMIGFGVPTESPPENIRRNLPEAARGPPYFYYENVALAPKGVWDTISRFLYEVEPEFVDSKFFCAAARKRGYIHNLPIEHRFPILPLPPRTIHDALPLTRRWWPHWDERMKLNCLQTAIASAKLTERIRKALEDYDGNPPLHIQKYIMDECRKWNLVWVGRNKAAPLEPDEVEMLLGFPRNHTRGGGISRTDRYKSLGNSFQVDTVAYHLSVLKDMFPEGMTVLSLFSGIGGAEVALHRLGVRLKAVVSVEKSRVNRDIISSWWEQTNQKGILRHVEDVELLTEDHLEQLIGCFGGFDLVIGGSPCNNLAGSNRVSRDGLEGKESSLFFEYCRILDTVKRVMGRKE